MNSKRQTEEGKQETAMVRTEYEQQESDWRNQQIQETGGKIIINSKNVLNSTRRTVKGDEQQETKEGDKEQRESSKQQRQTV